MKRILVCPKALYEDVRLLLSDYFVVGMDFPHISYNTERWDLLVMDIGEGEGMVNFEALVKIFPQTPIVVVGNRKGMLKYVLEKGGKWYIRRPVEGVYFREIVRNLI